jgi:hypothetical protein
MLAYGNDGISHRGDIEVKLAQVAGRQLGNLVRYAFRPLVPVTFRMDPI